MSPPLPLHSTSRRGIHRVTGAILVVACALTVVACGTSPDATRATTVATARTTTTTVDHGPRSAGTYTVGTTTRQYVDDTRGTDEHGGRPARADRTLDTLVLYPAGGSAGADPGTGEIRPVEDAPPLDGPWPVVVFGHGSTTEPTDYLGKLAWWASAGYVIVAPTFPLSNRDTPGGTAYGDYPNQTGDESFVIDRITTDDTAPLKLKSLIDPDAIGLGGQSFGAITALGTVASACCADQRIKAATTFAAAWLPYPSGDDLAPWASRVPVLFVHGDDDPTLPYDGDHTFFERLGAPGGFLTLVDSGHDPGFFGGTGSEPDALVSRATLAFYDQYLKDGPDATPIIGKLVADAGRQVATFEVSGG